MEDLVLRRDVESLLLHSEQETTAVSIPRPGDSRIIDRGPISEGPGTRIGVYKILQQIGEGGFGVVYMAEQERPVRRKVALKIIKLGMDTKQVIARFEAERQALALMDHPNIAKVLDAGATETGRPYFVMELVRGIPITHYCDQQRLNTRQRLGLFMHVCYAIAHAHQKGIIHRDIKPSNVLVTLHDDTPVPKVIDFGIAKATSSRLTDKTLFTEFRQFIGTPEYMSPDQADISGLDIDTRTDIFSLGVLLFELLTGTTPLDPQTLRTAPDIQRIIREAEPPLPSTRVHSLGRRAGQGQKGNGEARGSSAGGGSSSDSPSSPKSSLQDIARQRRVEPSGLSRMLRGDLDWIVMKAMEKDRTRRYQTANELAADVKRHLSNEPVLAGPPSAVYTMRKFIRRHRLGVTVTMLMAATVLAGLSLASVGFVRASSEAAHSREVSDFLQSVIIDVDQKGGDLSVDEVVERGRSLFGDDHAIVGNLLTTRASSLSAAGRMEEAIMAQREALAFLEKANGAEHPSVAAATSRLAELLEERRELTEAEQLYRTALEMKRDLFGQNSKQVADALESLTSLLVETGGQTAHEEIKSLWRQTIDAYQATLGADEPTTVKQLCQFACWMMKSGYSEDAAALLPQAVERSRDVLGKDDLIRFYTVDSYAQSKILGGDYPQVISLIEELIDLASNIWSDDYTVEILLRSQLVTLNDVSGDRSKAEQALQDLITLRTKKAADSSPHPYTFQISQMILKRMSDWFDEHPEEGRRFARQIAADTATLTQPGSEQRAGSLTFVAEWFFGRGFYGDAQPLLAEAVSTYRGLSPTTEKARTETQSDLAEALAFEADTLIHLDRANDAEPLIRECIEIRDRVLEPDDRWLIDNARSILGSCLAGQERYEEAERILLDSYDKLRSSILVPADNQRKARERVIELYEKWGRTDEADKFRAPVKPIDPTS